MMTLLSFRFPVFFLLLFSVAFYLHNYRSRSGKVAICVELFFF